MATTTITPSVTSDTSSGTRTLYDPSAGNQLFGDVQNTFDNTGQYQGILDRYNQAQGATAANTKATGQYITGMYGGDINYEKLQTGVQKEGELESRRGFATNVAALTNLQKQGDQRVKQLTDQANNALMANNAAGAAALSDLAVKEQTAITEARTNFFNQYFSTQSEARAEAAFQTPEQKSVMDLSAQYPDANINPTDSLADAESKIKGSPLYSANLGKVNQDIETAKAQASEATARALAAPIEARAALTSAGAAATSAQAQAGLAGAQAQYQRTLTGILSTATDPNAQAQDVQSLVSEQATPQQIQDKYGQIPGGASIAQNILSKAQAQGYNLNAGTLTGIAQKSKVEAQNSGNLFSMFGSWLQDAVGGTTNALNSSVNSVSGKSLLGGPTPGASQIVAGQKYVFNGTDWMKVTGTYNH